MTKKELKDIIFLDHSINSKIRILDNLKHSKSLVKSMQLKKDVVKESRRKNTQEDLIIKIIDLEIEINKDIDRLIDKKTKAKRVIDCLDEPYGVLLTMRYIECMKWEEIAFRLGYSIQAVYKIHGQALKRVE